MRLHRVADRLHRAGRPALAAWVAAVNRALTGVEIEPGAELGEGVVIRHGHGLVVSAGVTVGRGCTLYQQVTLGTNGRDTGTPVLGDLVTVYAGAKVLGPVRIGDGAVIGANAVVLSDVPAGAIAVGVPARVID